MHAGSGRKVGDEKGHEAAFICVPHCATGQWQFWGFIARPRVLLTEAPPYQEELYWRRFAYRHFIYAEKDWSQSLWVDNKMISHYSLLLPKVLSPSRRLPATLICWLVEEIDTCYYGQIYLHYFPLCDLDFTLLDLEALALLDSHFYNAGVTLQIHWERINSRCL